MRPSKARFIRASLSAFAIFFVFAAISLPAGAEDGSELWLRYRLEEDAARRAEYAKYCGAGIASPAAPDAGAGAARDELARALPAILGKPLPTNTAGAGGCIYLGSRADHPAIAALVSENELAGAGAEGFVLRASSWQNRPAMIIAANSPRGVLYGAFALLQKMQLGETFENLNFSDAPKIASRMANHWDNPVKNTVERGYGGKSIFNWEELPGRVSPRLRDWARLLAAMRLNGVVVNNVNTSKNGLEGWRLLTPEYLPKLAALAGLLRPYGVKLYISVNFFSPVKIGSLPTADPLDPAVREWWCARADEIYKAIPDFGGFLVKADSEGEPGPRKYNRTHADGANMLATALAPHGGVVHWRAFVYGAGADRAIQPYEQFTPLDGKFAKNVFLQIKNGPIDFQVREPVSTLFGAMPGTALASEFQITQEYTGQDRHVCFLAPMWSEVLRFPLKGEESGLKMWSATGAIAGIMNIGDSANWTGHLLAQANTYAFGRLAWNPGAPPETIASEWARLTFRRDPLVEKTIVSILLDSWPAYENYTAPFAIGVLCDRAKHFFPAPEKRASFHNAGAGGMGTDRTAGTGAGYAAQFREPWRSVYENPKTCPEELLLFFHHLPHDYKLKSGATLIQAFYDRHNAGVATVRDFQKRWQSLRGKIDAEHFDHIQNKLSEQLDFAEEWRRSINNYFQKQSGIPDANDGAPPVRSPAPAGAGDSTIEFSFSGATILTAGADPEAVRTAASLFAGDIKKVTGAAPALAEKIPAAGAGNVIIAGTGGKNPLLKKLAAAGKLDLSPIAGKWEQYIITVIENPFPADAPHVKKALVVAGSDRRAVAFGLFSLSRQTGVSPWHWWADVPVPARAELTLNIKTEISNPPSVKYRGIFINDEDWGLLRWAKTTFDPERGNIGPKTYEKVCELLLRLNANYLCPAMHEASTAFNQIPENKEVADRYGIVMGSVHCEPLLFNNASEWHTRTDGEWDFVKNGKHINNVLRRRVRENGKYENVWTLALRGKHDKGMSGGNSMAERVQIMQNALAGQRQILADELKKPLAEIPQAFTPYKEVLDVYSHGLELPDEVTIVWPDDNYGYMKRLSNAGERKRSGRAGVYYHVSYLGRPHDYLWMASTPPALMYEELKKAYDTTADRLWLLNVGDIKSCEFAMTLFLEMAFDINAFNFDNVTARHAAWLAEMFGRENQGDFLRATRLFYKLAFARRPEFMGFGYEWNTVQNRRERVTDTEFSFANYSEARRRLADCDRMGEIADNIMKSAPPAARPALFQLFYHPLKGAELMNKLHLVAQQNRLAAAQGRASAGELRDRVKMIYAGLEALTKEYNELLDGKWNGIMSLRMGGPSSYYELPPAVDHAPSVGAGGFGIAAEGEDITLGARAFHALPCFNPWLNRVYHFEIYNKTAAPSRWSLSVSAPWIVVNKTNAAGPDGRVAVSVDWTKAPVGESILGEITVTAAGGVSKKVLVSAFNPATPARAELAGLYIEDNGCVSIPAAGFHRKTENQRIKMKIVHDLGYEGDSVQIGGPTAIRHNPANLKNPCLEYDFYTFHHGSVDVYTYALPTFPLSNADDYAGHESTNVQTKYGVCVDDGTVLTPTTSSFEYANDWYVNVLRNCAIQKSTLHIDKPGRHTLKIICGDPGTMLQKIVIDLGGMKRSYMGPPSTRVPANE
jgi:alpha-glucuronidase